LPPKISFGLHKRSHKMKNYIDFGSIFIVLI
jgi:hypothetical protein